MSENDKFLNKENIFGKLEFEAELDQNPLPEFLEALVENEAEAHKNEPSTEEVERLKQACTTDKGIQNQEEWMDLFNDMLLGTFDTENAFEQMCEKYTKALLDRGIQVAPHKVYQIIEMTNTRMIKLEMAKRLAMAHGLHSEWPQILEKELALVYGSRQPLVSGSPIKGNPVGES